ncbi:MAG: molybdopterin converting factor subunit 1 [Sterolibacterium sp.]|nr:molybdopterin converting factor subunit 1 [Sterolibacterium sp.]
MSLNILYFASLREALGLAHETLALPSEVHDVAALREHLAARGGAWATLVASKSLRFAVNQKMVGADAVIADGDEVAFFPPVTGG